MATTKIKYTRPPLYKKQEQSCFNDCRYAVTEAATKTGKTHSHIIWLLEQALSIPEGTWCWWVAPVYAQTDIAFKRLKRTLNPYIKMGIVKVNNTMLTITIVGAGSIAFKSGDRPDTLYGEDVYACVIDEASRCREEVWQACRSVVTATGGKIRLIGNVKGKNNFMYKLARRAEQGLKDWHYTRLTILDAIQAGIVDPEEAEDARSILPKWVYDELYMAVASDDGSNPFGFDNINKCSTTYFSNKAPMVWGWDVARAVDFTVGIALDEDMSVCRMHRWRGGNWTHAIQQIKDLTGKADALVDATGIGDVVLDALTFPDGEFSNFKGYVIRANTKQVLVETLCRHIQNHQIRFPEGIIKTELETFEYQYVKQGYVRYSAPEGLHDDAVIALGLAVYHFTQRPELPEWKLLI